MNDYPGMKIIIDEFVDGLPEEVAKLIDLANREDLLPLRRVAHQLRGTGGGYGFDTITDYAGKLEDSINSSDNPESISSKIHSLIDVIRRVEGFDLCRGKPITQEIENAQIASHH